MRTFLTLTMAIVMAVAAAFFANNWLEQQRQATVQEVVTVRTKPIVVAAVNIPFGTTLAEQHLKVVSIPEDSFSENTFTNTSDVVHKIAKQALYAGEPVRKERVAERGDTGGSALAAIVSPNMRAVTVRVNDVIGVAGFLLPGDYVDILASNPSENSRNQVVTRTVLERIKVLAIDQTASPEKDAPVIVRAVTLEVDPKQAELLMEATQEGAVQLALRNPIDETLTPLPPPEKPAEPPPVVATSPPPPPPPPQIIYRDRPTTTINVIRGDGQGVSMSTTSMGN